MKKAVQFIFACMIILGAVCTFWLASQKNSPSKESVPAFKEGEIAPLFVEEKNYDEEIASLTEQINQIISGKSGIWSVYVKNLDNGMTVVINDRQFIAASVIKLYNMIALYDEIEKGNIVLTESIQKNLEQMITVSSNEASNTIVTTIGTGNFDEGAKKVTSLAENIGCENTYEQHMLYNDRIPSKGRNRTSVKDCGIILEKIYLKQCVSPEYDEKMLELLKEQTLDFKIPANLPENVVVANKTGENSNVEADVGIVFSPACDYIICISAEKFGGKKPISTIAEISECVYNFFNLE